MCLFFVIEMLFNECPYVSPIYVFQIYLKVIKNNTSDGKCKDGDMCGLSGLVHGRLLIYSQSLLQEQRVWKKIALNRKDTYQRILRLIAFLKSKISVATQWMRVWGVKLDSWCRSRIRAVQYFYKGRSMISVQSHKMINYFP